MRPDQTWLFCQYDSRTRVSSSVYRVSHIIGPTLFLPFSRLLEHIQRNFS